MDRLEIVSVVGARPNFVKLGPVHNKIKDFSNHYILHTGQHYDFEMSEIFFKEFSLPVPNFNLGIGSGSQGLQVGEMIKKIEKILTENHFDLALVYGDTNSTFAGAFAANACNIKVAHVEAGLRSFDRRMPEEINRILTDNLSEILFAPVQSAVENLRRENIFGNVVNTGDLSVEIIENARVLAKDSRILEIVGLNQKSYILFTMHRQENTASLKNLSSIVKSFEQLKNIEIIFPIHPRTKKVLKEFNLLEKLLSCKNVKLIDPVGYIDFIALIQNSSKIVTDSGGAQKEAYLLSVPCITIRKSTEWVETVEQGWNVLVDTDTEKIVEKVKDWFPSNTNQKAIFGNGDTAAIIKEKISELNLKK